MTRLDRSIAMTTERLSRRSRLAAIGLAIAAALLAVLPRPALAERLQRMVIAPGCYEVTPGGTASIGTYCLDEKSRVPPPGALLTQAPAPLGDAVARRGEEALGLQSAITAGWLQIEGTGELSQLRLRNASSATIVVCIRAPSVVMSTDGSVGALDRAYALVRRLVAEADREPGERPRAQTQRAVWDAMNSAEQEGDARTADAGRASKRPRHGPLRCSQPGAAAVLCLDE